MELRADVSKLSEGQRHLRTQSYSISKRIGVTTGEVSCSRTGMLSTDFSLRNGDMTFLGGGRRASAAASGCRAHGGHVLPAQGF